MTKAEELVKWVARQYHSAKIVRLQKENKELKSRKKE